MTDLSGSLFIFIVLLAGVLGVVLIAIGVGYSRGYLGVKKVRPALFCGVCGARIGWMRKTCGRCGAMVG